MCFRCVVFRSVCCSRRPCCTVQHRSRSVIHVVRLHRRRFFCSIPFFSGVHRPTSSTFCLRTSKRSSLCPQINEEQKKTSYYSKVDTWNLSESFATLFQNSKGYKNRKQIYSFATLLCIQLEFGEVHI